MRRRTGSVRRVPDEICIFMRTFIGSIGSIAPTRCVPYSNLEFPRFPFCCEALAPANGWNTGLATEQSPCLTRLDDRFPPFVWRCSRWSVTKHKFCLGSA